MRVDGKAMRSIWLEPDGWSVGVIDQTVLPHRFATARLTSLEQAAHAIRAMVIRGAPLIGATAAYGICLALRDDAAGISLRAVLKVGGTSENTGSRYCAPPLLAAGSASRRVARSLLLNRTY